jgi:hypothetical protein
MVWDNCGFSATSEFKCDTPFQNLKSGKSLSTAESILPEQPCYTISKMYHKRGLDTTISPVQYVITTAFACAAGPDTARISIGDFSRRNK